MAGPILGGGSFKSLNSAADKRPRKSTLNQLIDVIQEDVSGSATRRKYQVFVTGGIGPGVTSSLFQTVHDQDFTLQTANPICDITFGLYTSSSHVTSASSGEDSTGKLLFPSETLMMREKVDIYKQYASTLLGDSTDAFFAPFENQDTAADQVNAALFLSFKRLFARDKIKRETFALRMYRSGVVDLADGGTYGLSTTLPGNVHLTSISGAAVFTDIGASTNIRRTFGGEVGNVVNSAATSETVGLIFYDHGTIVLDVEKCISGSQHVSGVIDGMRAGTNLDAAAGQVIVGDRAGGGSNTLAKFVPDFVVSASVDNIVDHFASCRFSSGSLTAGTFQNVTNINSTLFFCRATADEFNYSTNPTFINSSGRIRVIDVGQEDTQRSFTFVTTVGLHDQFGNLLAVAKLSRPVEKTDERDITFRIRLDF